MRLDWLAGRPPLHMSAWMGIINLLSPLTSPALLPPPHTSKQTTDLISEIEEACDGLHPGDQDGMERADARLRILAPEVTHAVVDGTYLALQESTMAELRHFEEVRPRERCFFDFFFWGRVGLCVAVVFWVAHRQIRFPSKGGV